MTVLRKSSSSALHSPPCPSPSSYKSKAVPPGARSPPYPERVILKDSPDAIATRAPAPVYVEYPSTQKSAAQPSAKEEALVEALTASQAANDALEGVVKMQQEAIQSLLAENKKLWLQAQQALASKAPKKPTMCEACTEILPEEGKLLCAAGNQDASAQTDYEVPKIPKVEMPLAEAPLPSPRIQPPAVPPTPRRLSHGQVPLSSPRIQPVAAPLPTPRTQPLVGSPTPENVKGLAPTPENVNGTADLNIANSSPYVAEAFRLGWLAGVKSNSLAANRAPSSTRSDDSPPSDPGSFIMGDSQGSTSGSEAGSPAPGDKLPALPTMMPPPPPPTLFAPPAVYLDQLG